MEKGHLEVGEALVAVLLLIGVVAGLYIMMNQPRHADASGLSAVNDTGIAPNESSAIPEPKTNLSVNPPGPSTAQIMTNSSLGQLMDEGVKRADSRFYKGKDLPSGDYRIDAFQWYLGVASNSPDNTSIVKNDLRVSDVRFNDRYVDSLRAFIFKTYVITDLSSAPKLYGTAIFYSDETPLDGFVQNQSAFRVYYGTHPTGPKILDGCVALSKNISVTLNGNPISIYDISCKSIYEAN